MLILRTELVPGNQIDVANGVERAGNRGHRVFFDLAIL